MRKNLLTFLVAVFCLIPCLFLTACNNNPEVEVAVNGGMVQWRYENEQIWNDIISIDELKGEDGQDGTNGTDGVDATYENYTVTFDYGIAETYFDNAIEQTTVKSTEWITNLPTIKKEYENLFKGWYIIGTDKKIENYDFVGGNVTLEARFTVSGMFINGNSQTILESNKVVLSPSLSENFNLEFLYYSQVMTEFYEMPLDTQVEGYGVLATDFSTLLSEYQLFLDDNNNMFGVDIAAPNNFEDMFRITFNQGNVVEACAEGVRAAGNLGGTGSIVHSMDETTENALYVLITGKIEWLSISDVWDTFIGSKIAEYCINTGLVSGVKVRFNIGIEQVVN